MKLEEFVGQAGWSPDPKMASGGGIRSSGFELRAYDMDTFRDPRQKKFEMEFLRKLDKEGSDGYLPDPQLNYNEYNKAMSMASSGLIDIYQKKYYITPAGKKWMSDYGEDSITGDMAVMRAPMINTTSVTGGMGIA